MKNGSIRHARRNGRTLLKTKASVGRKGNETLQLLMIEPTFAILDEIDSGLDI